MLRLTRTYKTRVSNRLAVFAAFLLIAATVAGVGGSLNANPESATSLAASAESTQGDADQGVKVSSVRPSKGFKVNLFLFRRN